MRHHGANEHRPERALDRRGSPGSDPRPEEPRVFGSQDRRPNIEGGSVVTRPCSHTATSAEGIDGVEYTGPPSRSWSRRVRACARIVAPVDTPARRPARSHERQSVCRWPRWTTRSGSPSRRTGASSTSSAAPARSGSSTRATGARPAVLPDLGVNGDGERGRPGGRPAPGLAPRSPSSTSTSRGRRSRRPRATSSSASAWHTAGSPVCGSC